jgi:hypothetical protein
LDIGINDWQKYGLQEQLNQTQHVNDKQKSHQAVKPFNLRRQKQLPNTSTEELLAKHHDKYLNYMKSTEQLLDESRI